MENETKLRSVIKILVVTAAIISAVAYASTIVYQSGWTLWFVIALLLAAFGNAQRDRSYAERYEGRKNESLSGYFYGSLIGWLVIFSVLVLILKASGYVFDWIVYAAQNSSPAFIAMAVLLGGGALFWFRGKAKQCYGLTEICMGMAIAAYKIPASPGIEETFIIALTGGLYLVVRGMDNWSNGKGNDLIMNSIEPFLQTFEKKLTGKSNR